MNDDQDHGKSHDHDDSKIEWWMHVTGVIYYTIAAVAVILALYGWPVSH